MRRIFLGDQLAEDDPAVEVQHVGGAQDHAGAAEQATQVLTWKAPTRTRNSPTKPLVPGRPTEASMKTMKKRAYTGMRCDQSRRSARSRVCRRS